jgi:hypothetical protein
VAPAGLSTQTDVVECRTVAGAGANMQWVVGVASQVSTWSGPGVTSAYTAPSIQLLQAPVLNTAGGETELLNTSNVGPGGLAFPVKARYGYALTQATHDAWYNVSCSLVVPHVFVSCTSAPGTGRGLVWEVFVGGQWGGGPPALTSTSYRPPTLTDLSGAALLALTTSGGQFVTLRGSQFGPATPTDPLRQLGFVVRYGLDPALTINATNCQVTVPHVTIVCATSAGAGKGHSWQVSVGDQWSNVLLQDFFRGMLGTAYAAPSVSYFDMADASSGRDLQTLQTPGHEGVRGAVVLALWVNGLCGLDWVGGVRQLGSQWVSL